jgi:hypothetical protein
VEALWRVLQADDPGNYIRCGSCTTGMGGYEVKIYYACAL